MEIYVDFDNKEIFIGLEEAKNYCLDKGRNDFIEWIDEHYYASEIWNLDEKEREGLLVQYIENNFGYRYIK